MAAPTYTYQALFSAGNEPDFTKTNEMAAQGWRMVFFNGDVPPDGGTRQFVYVMEKEIKPPEEPKPIGKKKRKKK